MKHNGNRGFTLLELLVVVIIIGILASVALPQFQKMTTKARSAEGANTVGAMLTAEYLYYQEKGTFASATTDLLVSLPADNSTFFNYTISSSSATQAVCKGTGSATTINGGKVAATVIVTGTIQDTGTRQIATAGI